MIGSALCALVAFAFVLLGIGSYVAPQALADNYGLPVSTPTETAYLRALGTRDFVLGLLIVLFLRRGDLRPALRATIGVSVLVAAGDLAAVASVRGRSAPRVSLAIHATGMVGLLCIAKLLEREL